jgi:S-formylglutathione hydrolase FrmB
MKFKHFLFLLLFSISSLLLISSRIDHKPKLQTIIINNIPVDILQNDSNPKGDILVLPGWNFSRTKWCDSTTLCSKALEQGYRLIMPEMGKSIYPTQYFNETRKDWLKYPTLTWVTDTMIPYLKNKYSIFKSDKNYLIGLSTGARGVLLIAENTNGLFKKAAALSGDYDQTKMTKDNLMTGVYGEYSKFKNRWQTIDNPVQQLKKLKTELYIGHGMNDNIVPTTQSQELYDSLFKYMPNLHVAFNNPSQEGHNFKYWNSEVDHILNFFQ